MTLLTVAEVCERTKLSSRYVYEAIRQGDLKAARFGSRRLVDPADLDEWVSRHKDTGPRLRAVQ